MMQKHAVIVAGGSGTRLGGNLPKQFQDLNGRPLLWWALRAFRKEDAACVIHLVLPEPFLPLWNQMNESLPPADRIDVMVHPGGATRGESVQSALASIPASDGVLVAVHDAARPLVSQRVIAGGWEAARKCMAAIPVVAVNDSLRRLEGEKSRGVDRSEYVAVQTPQVFISSVLKEAYSKAGDRNFTDDAAVVEANGILPALYPGEYMNMKVTNPGDLEIASLLLAKAENP